MHIVHIAHAMHISHIVHISGIIVTGRDALHKHLYDKYVINKEQDEIKNFFFMHFHFEGNT